MYTKTSNIKAQSPMEYDEKRNSLLWLLVWLESLLITSNIDRKKSLYSIPPMFSWNQRCILTARTCFTLKESKGR